MIEKICARLEEEREHSYADFCDYLINYELDNDFEVDDDWFYKGLIRAKKIVQEVAKEYEGKTVTISVDIGDLANSVEYGKKAPYQKGE